MRKLNLNIEFDLDGVLINYLDCLKVYMARRGIRHIPTRKWFFDTCPIVPQDKMVTMINDAMRDVDRIHPMPGAIETIRFLWQLTGDPPKITTARPIENIDVTIACIEKVLGDIPYFFAMLDNMDDKYRYIRSECYIDDRRRNAIELAKRGYTVFMPEREYNMPLITNVDFPGQIIVIKGIDCLLHPENLKLIIS